MIYRAPGERDRCPACESRRLAALAPFKMPRPVGGRRMGLVSGCEDCGLVFVNPPPAGDELTSLYSPSGEWARRHNDTIAADAPAPAKRAGTGTWPRMFAAIRDDLDVTRPPQGARVLDFGCGRGKFLDALAACGWETCGIEPAFDDAFDRHERLDAVPGEPMFDLIIVHHVLEHMVNPLELLRQLAAAAKPGAYVLVATPRLDTLPVHRDYSYVVSRVHVTSYTAASMTGLLARAGWRVVAPPDDEVNIAGGRRSAARLRLVARRQMEPLALPVRPLDSARTALQQFRHENGASALERRGCVRAAVLREDVRLRGLRALLPHLRGPDASEASL